MTGTLVDLLVLLGVFAIVVVAGWYVLSQVSLPDPIRKIIMIVLVILVAVLAIIMLLRVSGHRLGSLEDAPFQVAGGTVTSLPAQTAGHLRG